MKHILIKIISIILLIISIIIAIIGIVKSSNIFSSAISDFILTKDNENTWTSLPNQAKYTYNLNMFQYNPLKPNEITLLNDQIQAKGRIQVKPSQITDEKVNVKYKFIDLSVEADDKKENQLKTFGHVNVESFQIWNYIKKRSKTDISLQLLYILMKDLLRTYLESRIIDDLTLETALNLAFDSQVDVSKWGVEDNFRFNSFLISDQILKYKQSLDRTLSDYSNEASEYDIDYEFVTYYKLKYDKTKIKELKSSFKENVRISEAVIGYIKSKSEMERIYKSSNNTVLFQVNAFDSRIDSSKLRNFLYFDFEFQTNTENPNENPEKSLFLKENFDEIIKNPEIQAKDKIKSMLNDDKSEIDVNDIYSYVMNISKGLNIGNKLSQEEVSSYFSISKFVSEFFYEYSYMIGLNKNGNSLSDKIFSKINADHDTDTGPCHDFIRLEDYRKIKEVVGYDMSISSENVYNVVLSILYADSSRINMLIKKNIEYLVINNLYSSLNKCVIDADPSFSIESSNNQMDGLKSIFFNEDDIYVSQVKIITYKKYISSHEHRLEDEINESDLVGKDSFGFLYSQGYVYKLFTKDIADTSKFNSELFINYLKFLYKEIYINTDQVKMAYTDVIIGHESKRLRRLSSVSYLNGGFKEMSLYVHPLLSCYNDKISDVTLNTGSDDEENLRSIVNMNGENEYISKEVKYYKGNSKYSSLYPSTSYDSNGNIKNQFSLKSKITDGYQMQQQTIGVLDLSLL